MVVIAWFVYLWYKIDNVDKNVNKNYTEIILNASELTHIKNTTDMSLDALSNIKDFIRTN